MFCWIFYQNTYDFYTYGFVVQGHILLFCKNEKKYQLSIFVLNGLTLACDDNRNLSDWAEWEKCLPLEGEHVKEVILQLTPVYISLLILMKTNRHYSRVQSHFKTSAALVLITFWQSMENPYIFRDDSHASAYLRDNWEMFNQSFSSADGKVVLMYPSINPLKEHRLMITERYLSDSVSASSNKCVTLRRDIEMPIMMDVTSPFNLGQSPR